MKMFGVAMALAVMLPVSGVHAFGNACRRVDLYVTNDFADEITVENMEFYSREEGRYVSDNFRDVSVPQGAQSFLVRENETLEHLEGDEVTQIKVTWTHINNVTGAFHRHTTIDYGGGGYCFADRTYTATVD